MLPQLFSPFRVPRARRGAACCPNCSHLLESPEPGEGLLVAPTVLTLKSPQSQERGGLLPQLLSPCRVPRARRVAACCPNCSPCRVPRARRGAACCPDCSHLVESPERGEGWLVAPNCSHLVESPEPGEGRLVAPTALNL